MKATTVATFNEREHAEPVRKLLEDAGIHAEIFDERKLQKYWFRSEPWAGIHLSVDKKDSEQARKLLDAWHATAGVLRHAVRCPQCRSARVEYPQMTRKFITPELVGILFALHLVDREFYCTDCHYTWPKEKQMEIERDILGWPKESGTVHVTRPKPAAQH
jgi:hypothetical protein